MIALAAGLAACSSSSSTATPTAKASTAPTSATEAIFGKLAGPAVMSDNPVMHLTLTGLVATTGTVAAGSAPEKGESLTFRTAVGDLAVTYGSVSAPTGSLVSAETCLVVVTQTLPFTVDGAKSTGKFAGATGTGKAVAVLSGNLPKLSSGTCDESNNAQPSAKTAVATFTATAKLTVMK
jgi:hypothetical protein